MKTILIAEDNAANKELLIEVLSEWGYVVLDASTGLEALSFLEFRTPDLALLDIQMPELDGYGVVRRMREDPRFSKIPVIALTAFAMRGDREKALQHGFDGYVSKPLDLTLLEKETSRSTSALT